MKKTFNIALFSYHFPHKKTYNFIEHLLKAKYKISLIISAEFVEIELPKSKIKHIKNLNSEDLAEEHNIPYEIAPHNSSRCLELLNLYKINLGIISGARIINANIINAIKFGVLNFHPAMLPLVRGLDSVLWSISRNIPIGVTAHLINDKIDLGRLIFQEQIEIDSNDNLDSLIEKNYQLQLKLIPIALDLLKNKDYFALINGGKYNSRMSTSQKVNTLSVLNKYIKNHAKKN